MLLDMNVHFRKIELSDAIYVVDIQGYIGNQVSKEIEFAKSKEKEIMLVVFSYIV